MSQIAYSRLLGACILIVPTYPFHRELEAVLIAPFRHKVEVLVSTIDDVDASRVAGIGVENVPAFIPIENADALLVRYTPRLNLIVVVHLVLGNLLRRERHVILKIEIVTVT